MKSIATLRPASVTLPDLSRIIPMSSPGPQLGSVEIEKQVKTDNFDHLSHGNAHFLSFYEIFS